MNLPSEDFESVPHTRLHDFVVSATTEVGLPEVRARLLADMLIGNDLRGVFSHGTVQVATYAILMRDGTLNPQPAISVVQETDVSVLIDGDGGLGYFPAHEGTQRAILKAKERGMAVMMTRNHGHFGAAGLYSRMTPEHNLITYVTSGVQLHLKPGDKIYSAAGGSPMSFSTPAGEEAPLVLDFGTMHDLYASSPHRDEIARLAPGLVLRCIGMGEICQAWGGLLSGLTLHADPPRWEWPGANQGSMVITFRIDLFHDPTQFRQQMDEYVRAVSELDPLEGFEQSYVAGGVEADREVRFREEGVPVGVEHRKALEGLASQLGIDAPF
ncbi:MAG: Ldh family oxidoreductase [Candidatus Latescibacterota bacterium]|nr:Ldh family oxidoreductase [Candidatus Latescibacterota bacterium]